MVIDYKSVLSCYITDVLFKKTSITNIFVLKNLIQQYRVTYNSLAKTFIVHREENNNPNMHFRTNESGLQYYDPPEYFIVVTTVAYNKKH